MRWSRCLLRCRISDKNQTLTGAGEAHVEQSCMIAAQLCFFLWRVVGLALFRAGDRCREGSLRLPPGPWPPVK